MKSHLVRLSLALLLSVLLAPTSVAQTRRALVIGLGEQADSHWAKINGDRDVPYVKQMLTAAGYKPKNITTLVNRQATKAAILKAFASLTAQCQRGDVVYIHYSGHGQLVTDVNGDETNGWDESWIPYDAYLEYGDRDRGEHHLIDDEVAVLLTKLRRRVGEEGRILVVVDACHAGDSSRGDDDDVVRGVKREFVIAGAKRGATAKKAAERWITLSACKSYQLNQENRELHIGRLTYALYTLSLADKLNFADVQSSMKQQASSMPQDPVITGETSKHTIADFIKNKKSSGNNSKQQRKSKH